MARDNCQVKGCLYSVLTLIKVYNSIDLFIYKAMSAKTISFWILCIFIQKKLEQSFKTCSLYLLQISMSEIAWRAKVARKCLPSS